MNSLLSFNIVTPSFNQGLFLNNTIQSVLNQTYQNLEYLIFDGCSTDQTVEILKSYHNPRLSWVSEPDNGQPHAINKGFREVSEQEGIMAWINSDDVYLPDTFQTVKEAFADPEIMWVTGDVEVINSRGAKIDYYKSDFPESPARWLRAFSLGCSLPVLQPATFWRSSVLKKVGLLREDLNYSFDHEFFFRIFYHFGKPLIIKKPLAQFRLHDHSKTVSNSAKFKNENRRIFRLHEHRLTSRERINLNFLQLKGIIKSYIS